MFGTASHLSAGELEAVFLPELGMLAACLMSYSTLTKKGRANSGRI
jgi:hypothetical protein